MADLPALCQVPEQSFLSQLGNEKTPLFLGGFHDVRVWR
jgi:hypothetical protein